MSGEGNDDVHVGGEKANGKGGAAEPDGVRSGGDKQQRYELADYQKKNQRAALVFIAQRHEQKHAKRRADLAKHGNGAGPGDCQAKGAGNVGQQGLDIIDVGDDHADRDGHQPDGRLRHQCLFCPLCEWLRSSLRFIHSVILRFRASYRTERSFLNALAQNQNRQTHLSARASRSRPAAI